MKEALLELFKLLIQLGRLSTDDPTLVDKLKQKIALQKDIIDTLHGDSDMNDLEVQESIDDLTEILATSSPDPQYEEIPDDLDDTETLPKAAGGDGVEGETAANKIKSTSAAAKDAPPSKDEEDEQSELPEEEREGEDEPEVEQTEEEEEQPTPPPKKPKK